MSVTPAELARIWLKRSRFGPMDPVDEAELVMDRGLVGNANQGGRRQVTVLSLEAWRRAEAELRARVDPAARRANLLVQGIDLLQSGGRILRIGSCRLRLLAETRPCLRMDAAHPGLMEALAPDWRAGAYGTVLAGGVIRVGDEVAWDLEEETAP